jgi:glycerol-3-phosphate O-acyltransferase
MPETVTLPLWLAALLVLLAAWAALDRLLRPGVRWFLRRRVERVLADVDRRLLIRIQPFKLAKRRALVDQLKYDPRVLETVEELARAEGIPREALMARVDRYAREIVPAFNAYLYFRIGSRLSRAVASVLFRVRLGAADAAALAAVEPRSTVVFVMNHRSNLDYVLVAYLVASSTALSYAVGEWARIWPLQTLIRAMGAYFVRRRSENPLYRRVLERYVHRATAAGVTQAIYPEGRLSRDGALGPARLGLLDYMLRGFDPHDDRDIVFVPVGLNYDRVLEDRTLMRDLDPETPRAGAAAAAGTTLRFVARSVVLALRSRWYRFGYACVNFGTPLSARAWLAARGGPDLRRLPREERFALVAALGADLMAAVGRAVPVVPAALVAAVLVRRAAEAGEGGPLGTLELKARAFALMEELRAAGAHVHLPRRDPEYAVAVGLRMLALRRAVVEEEGGWVVHPEEARLVAFYANSIRHLLPEAGAASSEVPRSTERPPLSS